MSDKTKSEAESDSNILWMSEVGTKDWFIRYVRNMANYAKNPMPKVQVALIHAGLKKFDPKFAELCKKAHDSTIEFMEYAKAKMESKGD